ncbi:MAG: DnaD domain protein [Peptostreptococcaceae bacterium]|nr:DnaD domain protein [Peptostreptococcaceae bacterium]
MFFLEKQLLHNRDIVLPHSFFELVMPLLSSEPHAVGIYLYAYYMSTNTYDDAEPIHDHKKLAEKLGVTLDDVYNTWKICEDYGLIKKHPLDEEVAGSYSIEFRDLRTIVGNTRSKGLSTDELLVAYQNEEYKKMYDRIEQTIKYPLSANDIRKIHQMITDFNISKDLVVEAVLYSIYKKNSRSISLALGVLRNWHLDGIRTVEDLEQMMQGKEKRYLEYKKILRAMGEYRSATKPEKEMMDMWLDEYGFDLDSVLDAIGKTISIKSPNLKYVDGVLKNQLEAIRKMDQEAPQPILPSKEGESTFELRTKILELIRFPRKSLRRDEKDDLDELARDYHYSDIEIACRHLQKKQQEVTLANLLRLFKGEKTQQERTRKITLDQVKRAEAQKRYIKKNETVKNNTDEPRKLGPMEKRLYEKQLAQMKKREQE